MITRAEVEALDAADPLARLRDEFTLPDGVVYLDGNSLGALPARTPARLAEVIGHEWGQVLIRSWTWHGWIDAPRRVGDKIARLIGAEPGEVVVADSTSVNLFKLASAALRLVPERRVILSEPGNFPTDLYILQGLLEQLGGRHELRLVEGNRLAGAIDRETALVVLTQVDYRSGRLHDMAAVTAAAHAQGALVLWDLAHSAGALPVDLGGCRADLAIGCGYKYLNGGPGAPAFLYVARRWQDELRQPLSGWMGHAAPFDFETGYRPAGGIQRALCGTPPILSLIALECGVDVFAGVEMAVVRAKSLSLSDLFIRLVEQECAGHGFTLASPRDGAGRGSQVSFAHPDGYPIMQALIRRNVIGDFRAPDIVRFGFAPLYLRHKDVWDAVAVLREVMETRAWDRPELRERAAVT